MGLVVDLTIPNEALKSILRFFWKLKNLSEQSEELKYAVYQTEFLTEKFTSQP